MLGLCGSTVDLQVDRPVQCGRHICSEAYANNEKYMYTSVSDHIVDCSEFISAIYILT